MSTNPFDTEALEAREKEITFLLNEIDQWLCAEYEGTESFNSEFYESLHEQFLSKGDLSDKQIDALRNIHNRWVNYVRF